MKNGMVFIISILFAFSVQAQPWTKTKAQDWYARQGWLVGANFVPSTAINQLEMWQAETYDQASISRELGYAERIGLNTMRVFLHHAAWQEHKTGFKQRLNGFLDTCRKHHVKPMLVLFDDCWSPVYHTGKQPEPRPGIHNSGWLQDPGERYEKEPKFQDTLQEYVKDIIGSFKNDKRILLWDLYNEPGNNRHFEESYDLLQKVFSWAREINPSQPLTAGYWAEALPLDKINAFILQNSDIITYHCYEPSVEHQQRIDLLKKQGRPLICTEYMARKRGSTFFTILPMLKKENIGAINWGLVDGKTQTKYAWDEPIPDGSEPKLWFHDIFRKDGNPYDVKETDLIRSLTARQ